MAEWLQMAASLVSVLIDPAIVKQMTEILDAEPDTDCVCAFQETRHEQISFSPFFKQKTAYEM